MRFCGLRFVTGWVWGLVAGTSGAILVNVRGSVYRGGMEFLGTVLVVVVTLAIITAIGAVVWFAWLFIVAMFRTVAHEFRKPLDGGGAGGAADYIDDDEIDGMNEGDFRRYL